VVQDRLAGRAHTTVGTRRRIRLSATAGFAARSGRTGDGHRAPRRSVGVDLDWFVTRRLLRDVDGGTAWLPCRDVEPRRARAARSGESGRREDAIPFEPAVRIQGRIHR